MPPDTRLSPSRTISIALCTSNGETYLQEQLASIAGQDRPPDEVVVSDDSSTDSTTDIVREFIRSAPFEVRLLRTGRRAGSTSNFELAVGACTGDIIALADQDDVWLPRKLARIEREFAEVPGLAMAFSDAEVVDRQLQSLGFNLWKAVGFTPARQRMFDEGRGLEVLITGNKVTGATMAFDASYRDLILPFDDSEFHDAWIALMITAVAKVSAIHEPLIQYRQHGRNQVGAKVRDMAGMAEAARQPGASIYTNMAEFFDDALTHLSSRPQYPLSPVAIELLRGRAEFLRFRANLPENRLKRAYTVTRRLSRDGYFRYANGLKSFANDLVRPD